MFNSIKRDKTIIFVGFLWLVQSIGRLCFAAVGTPEGMGKFLDTPISSTTSVILFVMFLFLGILGLIAAYGLLKRSKWGFWSTMLASFATIAFDLWGLTIQFTAAIGLIVPIISILILYGRKRKFLLRRRPKSCFLRKNCACSNFYAGKNSRIAITTKGFAGTVLIFLEYYNFAG
jgi:hypothetical protein